MQTRTLALATLLGAFGAGLTGCELIAAVDHDLINQGGGGATTGGGGTGGTGAGEDGGGGTDPGGGGSGAGPECMEVEDCGVAPACKLLTCEDGECGEENAPNGTTLCDLEATDDGVCNDGECVECITEDQCEDTEVCSENGVCQPEHCDNNMFDDDGTETDVDCGNECEPCANKLDCGDAADCLSGFCDNDTCAPCGNSDDCAGDDSQWCDDTDAGGTCKDDLAPGVPCDSDDQCTGACADTGASAVCCDEACEGSCESCLMIHTGVADGTCAAVDPSRSADPKEMCADEECTTGDCAVGGACEVEPATTECGDAPTCDGDDLDLQQMCSGTSAACAAAVEMDCGTYSCDAGTTAACFTMCDAHAECADDAYCGGIGDPATLGTANTCIAKKGMGEDCAADVECISLLGCVGGDCAAI